MRVIGAKLRRRSTMSSLFERLENRQLLSDSVMATPAAPPPMPGPKGPPSTLMVGPSAPFHTIQAAVNAVTKPNTTINVAPGIYSEQVVIPNASKYAGLQINGQGGGDDDDGNDGAHGGDGGGDGQRDDSGDGDIGNPDAISATPNNSAMSHSTIIQAPTTPLTSSGAIVEISGAQNVTIWGVIIRGSASAGVAGLQFGVLNDGGASVTLSHDTITDIRQDAANLGNTVGYGVGVTSGTAAVDHTTITEYQRGGILVAPTSIGASGPATSPIPSASITHDTIDGSLSPVQTIHNGIVFLDGATGSVDHTIVSGNINTFTVPSFVACDGILLENSGVVSVTQDTLSHNDTNLVIDAKDFGGNSFYGSKQIQVSHLMINNATYDGIDILDGATHITIDHVTSDNNGWSGLFFDSFSGGNTVTESEFKSNNQSGLGFANIEDDTPESGLPGSGISNGGPNFGTQNSYNMVQLNHGMLSKKSPTSDFFDPNW